jgi:DNA-binding NarL/FixJ family response regulator
LDCVRHANPQARSVIITGFRGEMERRVQTALAGGASAVCYKPFEVDQLLKTVHKLCEEYKKE